MRIILLEALVEVWSRPHCDPEGMDPEKLLIDFSYSGLDEEERTSGFKTHRVPRNESDSSFHPPGSGIMGRVAPIKARSGASFSS